MLTLEGDQSIITLSAFNKKEVWWGHNEIRYKYIDFFNHLSYYKKFKTFNTMYFFIFMKKNCFLTYSCSLLL